jgi:uncharacterized protein YjbI with pentapeptide repeats
MANPEHVRAIRMVASDGWHSWVRAERGGLDLRGADLRRADLRQLHVTYCDFSGANLDDASMAYSEFHNCKFTGASLRQAFVGSSLYIACTFERAILARAYLASGRFSGTVFDLADMRQADGSWGNFRSASFDGADLRDAKFQNSELPYVSLRRALVDGLEFDRTVLTGVDFSGAVGLEKVEHLGPSSIDVHTVARSGGLPLSFLRGCGVPDEVIDYYQSIGGAIHFNSCFISHSTVDRIFADRLHADLQDRGIRCWYSPKNLKAGDRHRTVINEAIHVNDKLLLVLSKDALRSSWVESEVETGLEREARERRQILFPIRIDDEVTRTEVAWGADIRRRINMGDFTGWTDPVAYNSSLTKLVADLRKRADGGEAIGK